MTRAATFLGLALALLGPILIAAVSVRMPSAPIRLDDHIVAEVALVAIVVGVLLIVLCWEKQPLSSMGLRPPRWHSLIWGLLLAAFFMYVLTPVAYWILRRLHLQGFEEGLGSLARFPVWFLVPAVIIGGTAEELLYRGYAVERLARLTGNRWTGGLVSAVFFGLAHVPGWGWGPALTAFVAGGIATAFYIWKRDLLANIVAHVITDFVGIVVPPLLAKTSGGAPYA